MEKWWRSPTYVHIPTVGNISHMKSKGARFPIAFTLFYLSFSCDEAFNMLTNLGFNNCGAKRYQDWEYNVVLGFKQ